MRLTPGIITTHKYLHKHIHKYLKSSHPTNKPLQYYFSTTTNDDDNNTNYYNKVAFIGAGMMAEALIAPLVHDKVLGNESANRITIHDVSETRMADLSDQYGVQTDHSIEGCVDGADLIVLAVKPQNCEVVFQKLRDINSNNYEMQQKATLLSIIAGVPMSRFYNHTGIHKIARSMPNTPATIGKGVTVFTTQNIDEDEQEHIKTILRSFGKAVYVNDESFIDMATAISGSGPAYVFLLMEAMIDAGVHMGFSRGVAQTLVHQTLLGSTLYAMDTKEHPAILRNSVTSPAGTTASAIYELENGKFRTVIKDAIWACYRRSLQMGGRDSNVGPGRAFVPPVPTGEALIERNSTDGGSNAKQGKK